MQLTDEQLRTVAALSKQLVEQTALVDKLEDDLKAAKKVQVELESVKLPDALKELGLESLTLEDGTKVGYKQEYYGHISKDHEDAAFAWLREHGHGDIIKEVTKIGVHSQTLKAWIRERYENGDTIPDELFGVYIGPKATVKRRA